MWNPYVTSCFICLGNGSNSKIPSLFNVFFFFSSLNTLYSSFILFHVSYLFRPPNMLLLVLFHQTLLLYNCLLTFFTTSLGVLIFPLSLTINRHINHTLNSLSSLRTDPLTFFISCHQLLIFLSVLGTDQTVTLLKSKLRLVRSLGIYRPKCQKKFHNLSNLHYYESTLFRQLGSSSCKHLL